MADDRGFASFLLDPEYWRAVKERIVPSQIGRGLAAGYGSIPVESVRGPMLGAEYIGRHATAPNRQAPNQLPLQRPWTSLDLILQQQANEEAERNYQEHINDPGRNALLDSEPTLGYSHLTRMMGGNPEDLSALEMTSGLVGGLLDPATGFTGTRRVAPLMAEGLGQMADVMGGGLVERSLNIPRGQTGAIGDLRRYAPGQMTLPLQGGRTLYQRPKSNDVRDLGDIGERSDVYPEEARSIDYDHWPTQGQMYRDRSGEPEVIVPEEVPEHGLPHGFEVKAETGVPDTWEVYPQYSQEGAADREPVRWAAGRGGSPVFTAPTREEVLRQLYERPGVTMPDDIGAMRYRVKQTDGARTYVTSNWYSSEEKAIEAARREMMSHPRFNREMEFSDARKYEGEGEAPPPFDEDTGEYRFTDLTGQVPRLSREPINTLIPERTDLGGAREYGALNREPWSIEPDHGTFFGTHGNRNYRGETRAAVERGILSEANSDIDLIGPERQSRRYSELLGNLELTGVKAQPASKWAEAIQRLQQQGKAKKSEIENSGILDVLKEYGDEEIDMGSLRRVIAERAPLPMFTKKSSHWGSEGYAPHLQTPQRVRRWVEPRKQKQQSGSRYDDRAENVKSAISDLSEHGSSYGAYYRGDADSFYGDYDPSDFESEHLDDLLDNEDLGGYRNLDEAKAGLEEIEAVDTARQETLANKIREIDDQLEQLGAQDTLEGIGSKEELEAERERLQTEHDELGDATSPNGDDEDALRQKIEDYEEKRDQLIADQQAAHDEYTDIADKYQKAFDDLMENLGISGQSEQRIRAKIESLMERGELNEDEIRVLVYDYADSYAMNDAEEIIDDIRGVSDSEFFERMMDTFDDDREIAYLHQYHDDLIARQVEEAGGLSELPDDQQEWVRKVLGPPAAREGHELTAVAKTEQRMALEEKIPAWVRVLKDEHGNWQVVDMNDYPVEGANPPETETEHSGWETEEEALQTAGMLPREQPPAGRVIGPNIGSGEYGEEAHVVARNPVGKGVFPSTHNFPAQTAFHFRGRYDVDPTDGRGYTAFEIQSDQEQRTISEPQYDRLKDEQAALQSAQSAVNRRAGSNDINDAVDQRSLEKFLPKQYKIEPRKRENGEVEDGQFTLIDSDGDKNQFPSYRAALQAAVNDRLERIQRRLSKTSVALRKDAPDAALKLSESERESMGRLAERFRRLRQRQEHLIKANDAPGIAQSTIDDALEAFNETRRDVERYIEENPGVNDIADRVGIKIGDLGDIDQTTETSKSLDNFFRLQSMKWSPQHPFSPELPRVELMRLIQKGLDENLDFVEYPADFNVVEDYFSEAPQATYTSELPRALKQLSKEIGFEFKLVNKGRLKEKGKPANMVRINLKKQPQGGWRFPLYEGAGAAIGGGLLYNEGQRESQRGILDE